MNYRDWNMRELAGASPWQVHVDRRRDEALRPRRTASGYSIASCATVGELRSTINEWTALPRRDRAFAWSDDRVEERQRADPAADLAPNRPLDHLRRWDAGLARDETRWIGATAAQELHEFYRSATGYMPTLPSQLALHPAPTGPQASLAAARISGADFATDEARRQAFRRSAPRRTEGFRVLLDPDDLPEKPG